MAALSWSPAPAAADGVEMPLRALIYVADESEGGTVAAFDATTGESVEGIGDGDTTFDDNDHNQLAIGDVNGDGVDDLLIANQGDHGRIDVHDPSRANDDHHLGVPRTVFNASAHNQLAVGDVDNDGKDEILIADQTRDGRIRVYDANTHEESPGLGVLATSFDRSPHNQMVSGDLNGDGKDEILVADQEQDGRVDVYDAVTGLPVPGMGVPDTTFDFDFHNQLAVGDVTGDGKDEVLVADQRQGGQVNVYNGITGQRVTFFDTAFNDDLDNQLAVGDVDGDGRDEVLIINDSDNDDNDGHVDVLDARTGQQAGNLVVHDTRFENDSHNQLAVGMFGNADLDADGIPDSVELHGIRDNSGNVILNLPALGAVPASPCRKDVPVEIDYMEDKATGHSHAPMAGVLDKAKETLASGPANGVATCPYPGASHLPGINLIITDEPNLESIPEVVTVSEPDGIDALKRAHFTPGLDDYVHYSMWLHAVDEGGVPVDLSGQASPSEDDKDFLILLDGAPFDQQVVDFLHELGHTLGLVHGGDDGINCKPNYLSVMNYSFSKFGIPDVDTLKPNHYEYSTEKLTPPKDENDRDGIDEAHLDETEPIGDTRGLMTKFVNQFGAEKTAPASGGLDLNDDSQYTLTDTAADVNAGCPADPPSTPNQPDLRGFNDWAKLNRNLIPAHFGPNDPGNQEPTKAQEAHLAAFWDNALFPDTATQLAPPRDGFFGTSIGVALDADNVYAVHQYRTVSQPSTSDEPGSLVVLDRRTMTIRATITVGLGPTAVAVNPVTHRAYVVNQGQPDYSVSVIDTNTLQVVARIPLGQVPVGVAVNTKLDRVYVSNPFQQVIQVISGATNTLLQPIQIGPGPWGLTVDEGTGTLYVALTRRGQQPAPDITALGTVIDDGVSRPRVLAPVDLGTPGTQPVDVAVDPIRHRIYVAGLGGGGVAPSVIVLDQSSRHEITRIPLAGVARAITVNPHAGQVFIAGDSGVFVVNETSLRVERHMTAGAAFAIATDDGSGRQLYTGDFLDGTVRRLNYSSGTPQ
jgi:YVTN family beta-propeller protein